MSSKYLKIKWYYTLSFILIVNIKAFPESLLQQIRWNGASDGVIYSILLVILFSIVGLSVYYWYTSSKKRKAIQEYSFQKFNETAKRLGLTPEEKKMANRLILHEKVIEPQVIFQSASIFERCVEKEVERIRSAGNSEEQRNEINDLLSEIRKKTGFHWLPLEHPLTSSRNITMGQIGAIFGKNSNHPIVNKASISSSNEFEFKLKYDVDEEDFIVIKPGEIIRFAFSRQGDSVYGFTLKVVSANSAGEFVVQHTTEMKRNQLRQYVRMDLSLPLKYRLLNTRNPDLSEIQKGVVVSAKMSDISGGGISFISEKSLRAGDIISLTFSLPAIKISGIGGKVLRISVQEGKVKTFYKHHIKFVKIENRDRDGIVKYVFDKQRQQSHMR